MDRDFQHKNLVVDVRKPWPMRACYDTKHFATITGAAVRTTRTVAVSYTHLDVYKRQIKHYALNMCIKVVVELLP